MAVDPNTANTSRDTLYYDGACPLCSKEMKNLAKHRTDDDIHLVDIRCETDSKGLPSKELRLRKLHLKTASGEWLTGIDANIHAWQNTPYEKLWSFLRLPLVYPVAKAAYQLWASWRFRNSEKL